MFEPYSFQTNLVNFSWTGISATSHYMRYGAEAVAYLVQRLYQSLSEEIAMALCTFFCSPITRGSRKPYQRVGKTNNKSIMPNFMLKGTAKINIGKIPMGTTIQVISQSNTCPSQQEVLTAVRAQLGINESNVRPHLFKWERVK